MPALHQAAAHCLGTEPTVPVQPIGAVVGLRSDRPRDGGTMWLRVLVGG